MVSVEQIKELLKYGEKINLECKKAESNLPKSVRETYSSFANTTGGIILFGVEEKKTEIKAMLREASDSGNDGGILDGYTLEDIDYDTLKSYRIEYELRNPEHV